MRVRGNVDTRLRKLADGEADALVLALAGLQRLGRADAAGGTLDRLVPAAGQGALAIEARAGGAERRRSATRSTIEPTMACVLAERALVHALDARATRRSGRTAGCSTTAGRR